MCVERASIFLRGCWLLSRWTWFTSGPSPTGYLSSHLSRPVPTYVSYNHCSNHFTDFISSSFCRNNPVRRHFRFGRITQGVAHWSPRMAQRESPPVLKFRRYFFNRRSRTHRVLDDSPRKPQWREMVRQCRASSRDRRVLHQSTHIHSTRPSKSRWLPCSATTASCADLSSSSDCVTRVLWNSPSCAFGTHAQARSALVLLWFLVLYDFRCQVFRMELFMVTSLENGRQAPSVYGENERAWAFISFQNLWAR